MSDYISTNEALRMLPLMKREALIKHAKGNWEGKRVGNNWYWNKNDICYPDWEASGWQKVFVLPFMTGLTDEEREHLTYYDILRVLHEFFPYDYRINTPNGSSVPAMFLFNSIDGMANITYRDSNGEWNNITEKIDSKKYRTVMDYVQLRLVALEGAAR